MENQEKIEKMVKNYETYGDFLDDLEKDHLNMIRIVIKSWMSLQGVKPEDKIPEDWKVQGHFGKEESMDPVNKYLGKVADEVEPKTHCCECTPGDHYERHIVHIQYPGCNCDPEKYVLKVNYEL